MQECIRDLNKILKASPALFCKQFSPEGFEWVDLTHRDESVITFRRKGIKKADDLLIILNLTPVTRTDWEIELKEPLFTREIFNSDDIKYGGSGSVNNKVVKRTVVNKDEKKYKLIVNLPPLSGIILK